ncbi:MAG: saccharopine dehydrogenase NADP-binding domain-containing protein [Oculatellaceae cyanobacterium bins.114]|nr:saccharopine dehydrogenase NADP-binding domain-containing protein [Oculatellaceae cyanobacterium bins.114]
MADRVLILGGRGRIGSSVAADLIQYTDAHITITGRSEDATGKSDLSSDRTDFLALNLSDDALLKQAIAQSNLVVHCAGPFHYRDGTVLDRCIDQRVNYLDVSDNAGFTQRALSRNAAAAKMGVTAIVNSGIFPGISNSMVRHGVEQLDDPEQIHLSYVVSGSGGAGITVMRTTFLGLLQPFNAWLEGSWQKVKPYSDRQPIQLPDPYGKVHVYWFEMPETFTLAESFPVKTVVTKFGSVPDFYNHLTWIAAHVFPKSWIRSKRGTEFLAQVSFRMTNVTDRVSGIGVGIRSEVTGKKDGQPAAYVSTLVHDNTAIAAGNGTGSIAQLLLSGQLHKPGVWAVEQALTTELFEQTMQSRNIQIHHDWVQF